MTTFWNVLELAGTILIAFLFALFLIKLADENKGRKP